MNDNLTTKFLKNLDNEEFRTRKSQKSQSEEKDFNRSMELKQIRESLTMANVKQVVKDEDDYELPTTTLLKVKKSKGDQWARLAAFEKKFPKYAPLIEILALSLLIYFCLYIHNRDETSQRRRFPYIQTLFMTSLIIFLLNFLYIRKCDIRPFFKNQNKSYQVKRAGFAIIFAILLLNQSLTYGYPIISGLFFFNSWIFIDFFHNMKSQNIENILPKLIYILGVIISQMYKYDENFDSRSFFFAFGACYLFSAFISSVKNVTPSNPLTTIHSLTLQICIVTPLMFPLEGLVQPSGMDMINLGILTVGLFTLLLIMQRVIKQLTIEQSLFQFAWVMMIPQLIDYHRLSQDNEGYGVVLCLSGLVLYGYQTEPGRTMQMLEMERIQREQMENKGKNNDKDDISQCTESDTY